VRGTYICGIPSILGSLPFGKSGFNDLGNNMPVNNSLIGIMKRAGYHTAFYYGGDSKFDNMKLFLQKKVSTKSMTNQLLQVRISQIT
jgi:hypothetical protein